MAERSQSSKRRDVAGNPRFPGGGGGVDRISGLADDLLGHILSLLPAHEAARSSALSRRWRRAWTHAPDLKISDELHQDRFLDFAGAVLAQYGAPDIPSLNVAIRHESNLGPATAAWLRDAMERVVGSICVKVKCYTLDQLVLPRSLKAKSITLDLSDTFSRSVVIFPEPAGADAFGRLAELSLSNVNLQLDGIGEFFSSFFPQLRKLRLRRIYDVTWNTGLKQFILHMDMLEELEVGISNLMLMQVVAAKLRLLTVSHGFESLTALTSDTMVKISAPRLEVISWSGRFPKHLNFLTDVRCVRRLAGLLVYWPDISRVEYSLRDVVQFLEICSGADQLDVCVDIQNERNPSMLARQDFMEYIPCLPNIRTLSLKIITILRRLLCPIGPSVFSFLRRCPNITLLHIDLSILHQFTRHDRSSLVFPVWLADSFKNRAGDQTGECLGSRVHRTNRPLVWFKDKDDDVKTEAAKQCHGFEFDRSKPPKDQLQLVSLRKIRISGFVGSDPEMELADLLFGAGAALPALDKITISSFVELSGCMDRIALKLKARFPLTGGRWEISPLEENHVDEERGWTVINNINMEQPNDLTQNKQMQVFYSRM